MAEVGVRPPRPRRAACRPSARAPTRSSRSTSARPAVERLHDAQRHAARLDHALHQAAADQRRILLDDHDGLHATAAVVVSLGSASGDVVAQPLPEVERRVRPPGAPGLGAPLGLAGGRIAPVDRQGAAQPEVGRREGVGVAERAHRDVVCRPLPHAGQRDQRDARRVGVGGGPELEPVRARGGQRGDGATAGRGGQADLDEVVAHERGRAREGVRQRAVRLGQRLAVRPHQPAGQRGGAAHRHLLAEDRAHRDLEAVPGAGDAQAGAAPQQAPEHGVGAERTGDGQRVGVEVEDVAHAAHDAGRVAEQGRGGAHEQRTAVGRRRDLHDADRVSGPRDAAIGGALHGLDARDRAGGEVRQHGVPVQRRAVREPQHDPGARLRVPGAGCRRSVRTSPSSRRRTAGGCRSRQRRRPRPAAGRSRRAAGVPAPPAACARRGAAARRRGSGTAAAAGARRRARRPPGRRPGARPGSRRRSAAVRGRPRPSRRATRACRARSRGGSGGTPGSPRRRQRPRWGRSARDRGAGERAGQTGRQ